MSEKKKIKIIDLLNKISKNQDVPDSIIYNGIKYSYTDNYGDYIQDDDNTKYLFKELLSKFNTNMFINESMDILEDTYKYLPKFSIMDIENVINSSVSDYDCLVEKLNIMMYPELYGDGKNGMDN